MLRLRDMSFLINSVVIHIEVIRELPTRVDFLVLEFVIVETDSLEVDNEVVGEIREEGALDGICFLFARVAHVVRDDFSLDELLEGLVVVLESFDVEGYVEVVFLALLDVLAVGADELVAAGATVDGLQHLFEWCSPESFFKSVEEHVEELLGVLLDGYVDRVAVEIFEGETELVGIVLLPLCEFEIGEHGLELMEDVVIDLFGPLLD